MSKKLLIDREQIEAIRNSLANGLGSMGVLRWAESILTQFTSNDDQSELSKELRENADRLDGDLPALLIQAADALDESGASFDVADYAARHNQECTQMLIAERNRLRTEINGARALLIEANTPMRPDGWFARNAEWLARNTPERMPELGAATPTTTGHGEAAQGCCIQPSTGEAANSTDAAPVSFRRAYVCRDCDGVYADQPVSQCDCLGREIYDEFLLVPVADAATDEQKHDALKDNHESEQ